MMSTRPATTCLITATVRLQDGHRSPVNLGLATGRRSALLALVNRIARITRHLHGRPAFRIPSEPLNLARVLLASDVAARVPVQTRRGRGYQRHGKGF